MNAASNLAVEPDHRDDWMTIEDAARALDETRYMILRRVAMGELVARPIAGAPRVTRASVERVLAEKGAASSAA